MNTTAKATWGLLPEDVLLALKNKYWQNPKNLKSLLKNGSSFPLVVHLKPPRGSAAIQNIGHFQRFVSSWQSFSPDSMHGACQASSSSKNQGFEVIWEQRNFRSLAAQNVPTQLKILDIGSLACMLGSNEQRKLQSWLQKIRYIFQCLTSQSYLPPKTSANEAASTQANSEQQLFQVLIDHLETLDAFKQDDLQLLVSLLPQLQKGMGQGCYLRALAVTFVDTKFIEKNLRLIESIVTALLDNSVKDTGLMSWLDCQEKPKDWLLVKPLCQQTRAKLGGLPLFRLSSDTLQNFELPAKNILVIENEQSCLALHDVGDTIAVSGGGKNIAWLQAGWLADKNVAYWGDIDSEGLAILSDVRSKLSSITALMMNEQTVKAFAERMVPEPDSISKDPVALTAQELALFKRLRADSYTNKRLEQERLPMEYVAQQIDAWLV